MQQAVQALPQDQQPIPLQGGRQDQTQTTTLSHKEQRAAAKLSKQIERANKKLAQRD